MDPRVPTWAPGLAGRLADAVRPILSGHYRQGLLVDGKLDHSPVTNADRESEAAIRSILSAEVPDHGVIGEEHGVDRGDAEYVWAIDPLDGTRAFVSGKPQFGSLIALCHKGSPIVGVIDMPILRERWVGVLGVGTTLNGIPQRTRAAVDLREARMGCTTLEMFPEPPAIASFNKLRAQVHDCNFGGDCYNYAVLASGFLDIVVETSLKPWDFAAIVPVILAAGGSITDWQGRPLLLSSAGDVVASSDSALHRQVLPFLK
jgi:inositol-phosphate phosphatase/L-galactose 1-phosphate phosphatase/histidinol-phosphatase